MKKLILFLLITTLGFAQAPTKNANGFYAGSASMNGSAIGQFDSTSKGFLFPRMTTTQRNAISSPATSLVIFNTTTGTYNYYNGTAWTTFGGGGSQTLQQTMELGRTYGQTISGVSYEFGFDAGIGYTQVTDATGYVSRTEYSASSQVNTVDDALNNKYVYDSKRIDNGYEINLYDDTAGVDRGNRLLIPFKISGTGVADFVIQNNLPAGTYELATLPDLEGKADLNGSTSEDFNVPTLPTGANSAVSKNYLDNALTGLTWKNAVKCSTTANHSLSGTANVDGVTVPSGTRVLVRFQTSSSQNGIYLTAAGSWTRSLDADDASELTETTVLVTSGTLFKNTQWTQNGIITTVGTDPITFVQVAGAGTYTNGTGIDLTANVFSVDSSVTRNTSVQTLTNKTISGINNAIFNIPQDAITNLSSDLALKMDKSANGSDIANVATFRNNLGFSFLPYKFIQTSQTAHTGTTNETIIATAIIAENTFNTNDVMKMLYRGTKPVSIGNVTFSIKVNTSNTLTGAVTISSVSLSTNQRYICYSRNFDLNGGNLYGQPFTSNTTTDFTFGSSTVQSTPYNTANILYVFFTIQLANAADSATPNLCNITN